MVKWLFISFLLEALSGAACLIWTFVLFDRILRRMHAENHAEWEKLGKPIGFFWVPAELRQPNPISLLRPSMARAALFGSFGKSSDAFSASATETDYSKFRFAALLGRICFAAALLSVAVLAAIFL